MVTEHFFEKKHREKKNTLISRDCYYRACWERDGVEDKGFES